MRRKQTRKILIVILTKNTMRTMKKKLITITFRPHYYSLLHYTRNGHYFALLVPSVVSVSKVFSSTALFMGLAMSSEPKISQQNYFRHLRTRSKMELRK